MKNLLKKEVKEPKVKACSVCNGTGRDKPEQTCPACEGTGKAK